MFYDIFPEDEYTYKKSLDRVKREMIVKVTSKQGVDFDISHPYKGGKPTDKEIESMYKKSIYYLCRTCLTMEKIKD